MLAIYLLSVISAAFGSADGKITLTVWQLPDKEARSASSKAEWAVVQRFMELHPDIRLEGFKGLNAPGMDLDVGPLMAMAGGVAPDVLYVNFRISDSYIQQKFLYPLDEYVNKWVKEEDLSERIYPPVWQVIKRGGHVWAIPYRTIVSCLQYRKDLFRKAGLDAERPPKTWNELYEYAKKLTIPEKGQYGFALMGGPQAGFGFNSLLLAAGGEAVIKDRNGNWRAAFNDDAALTAIRFYQKLGRERWTRNGKAYRGVTYRDPSYERFWNMGKIGMAFGYMDESVMARNVNPNEVGFAPTPAGPTGIRANELNCSMLGINSQVKDKRVRDAAWEYIKFMGSEEAIRILVKVLVEAGQGKFIAPKYLRRYGYSQYLKEVPKEWGEVLEEALRHGQPEPYGSNCQMIYMEMTPPLDKVWLSDNVNLRGELDKAVKHCNEKLMGIVDPQVMAMRRRVALVVVVVLFLAFVLVFRCVARSFSGDSDLASGPDDTGKDRRRSNIRWRRTILAFLIMFPALVSVFLWQYYPLAKGSVMAFQDYKIIAGARWVGLDNFADVLFTPQVWKSFWNSFLFMILSLGLGFFSPILLAMMLHEVPRGKILYRTLYYLPAVTTGLVIMFLWKFLYDPSPAGFLNQLLAMANDYVLAHINHFLTFVHVPLHVPLLQPQTWLQDPRLAMLCVIIPTIWAGVGPGCIIYLAAMKSIPEDVYEAADLDGAGVVHKVKHITIPYLRPLIIINFVGAFIGAFRSFDFIFVMTGGGPMQATHVAGLEIWYDAFLYLKFGFAVAMAWLLGTMLIGFTVFQLRILSRLQFKTGGT